MSQKAKGIWKIPAKVVAYCVGCGESTVVNVRAGIRADDTNIGQKIKIADELLIEGASLLMDEVKKAVNPEA